MTLAREVAHSPCPAYKISKAALNALTVQYAISYEDEGFVFLAVNPGVSRSSSVCRDFLHPNEWELVAEE